MGNNLLSWMSKVRHLNSLPGSENRSGPVSKVIFKFLAIFLQLLQCGADGKIQKIPCTKMCEVMCVLWPKRLWDN